ncbi:hypothetical protein MUCCIDRAFT_155085 [Mucor lusitanicus CBS 277.49]|uniref:Uncharacterized protein n=3 Tax=Mucor circinelloides f. lusitanicus TaxID=29924 RepID=A0A168QCX7_MUCCL|nr:hypothetical protein MUCCIDRAFT_155085 [Mucor lusitanicus CBS 277.49]
MNDEDDYADEDDDGNAPSSLAADSVSGDVHYQEEHEPMEGVIQQATTPTATFFNNGPIDVAANDLVKEDVKMDIKNLMAPTTATETMPAEAFVAPAPAPAPPAPALPALEAPAVAPLEKKEDPEEKKEMTKVENQDEAMPTVSENVAVLKTEE